LTKFHQGTKIHQLFFAILTIVGQYVCFQIYEIGELVTIHKRGLNQIWLHVKEEREKKFKNHASSSEMLEPNVI
jgi:hypothetical protein